MDALLALLRLLRVCRRFKISLIYNEPSFQSDNGCHLTRTYYNALIYSLQTRSVLRWTCLTADVEDETPLWQYQHTLANFPPAPRYLPIERDNNPCRSHRHSP